MATTLIYPDLPLVLVTGANGPYTFDIGSYKNKFGDTAPTLWYNLGTATSVTVTYSVDGGLTWSLVSMTSQNTGNGGHYENSGTIVGSLGWITLTVVGTPNAESLWGIT